MSVFGKSLTRQEWNASYVLGLEEVVKGRFQGPLNAQLRRGIEILACSGYTFEVQALLESGGWFGDGSLLPDEHERACREIAGGDFDAAGRAREALRWLQDTAPEIDRTWVQRVAAEGRVYEGCPPEAGASLARGMKMAVCVENLTAQGPVGSQGAGTA